MYCVVSSSKLHIAQSIKVCNDIISYIYGTKAVSVRWCWRSPLYIKYMLWKIYDVENSTYIYSIYSSIYKIYIDAVENGRYSTYLCYICHYYTTMLDSTVMLESRGCRSNLSCYNPVVLHSAVVL